MAGRSSRARLTLRLPGVFTRGMWAVEATCFNQFHCGFSATVCTADLSPWDQPRPEAYNPPPRQVNLAEREEDGRLALHLHPDGSAVPGGSMRLFTVLCTAL